MFYSNYYKFILFKILLAFYFLKSAFGDTNITQAAPETSPGHGACFDTEADKYFPNAIHCVNEGELLVDPEFNESLCSTNTSGRFNNAELYRNDVQLNQKELEKTRNKNCIEENQLGFVARCLRSCKLCCQDPRFDSCKDNVMQCNPNLCTNMAYALTQCPSTCGKCKEKIAQNKETELCADIVGDCMAKKILGQCEHEDVKKNCALTCNDKSTNNECKDFTNNARSLLATPTVSPLRTNAPVAGGDKATNCKQNEKLCNNPVYRDFMQDNCQETCKSSSTGGGGTATCGDRPHTSCAIWKMNGFCENDFYTQEQKKNFCGSTCKLC